ncbi:hypothetical protein JCM3775_005789 [Rhodotorula graminis]|uniref:NCA2-domain-containing protein n=1 Tax=Rhodotorula graminis (strain WP1) TaxID=578459 RepID=A0A194S521_RHOGW|nr:uncharacterized protein RHOBADRAFT_52672 [Rhodotorula graminis WP1]KPV75624.1 hypothetical protein RHOBADRAFT_52672 [Rhodotorula graminis WP1]
MASYAAELTAHLSQALTAVAPSLVEPSPASSPPHDHLDPAQPDTARHPHQDQIDDREHTLRHVLGRLRTSHASSSSSSSSPSSPGGARSAPALSSTDLARLVDEAFPPFQGTAALPLSPQTATVELVTLAQLTIHAWGLVLRTLIHLAAQLDHDDDYWARLESDPYNAALYLVQTSPARAVALSSVTATRLRKLTHGDGPADLRPSLLDLNTWRRALPPSLFLASVFPHLAQTSGLPSLADLDHSDLDPSSSSSSTATAPTLSTSASTSLSLSSATRLTRHAARSLVFLTLSPLALTRQEIAHRRAGIRNARDELALRIGELTLAASQSDVGDKLLGGEQQHAGDGDDDEADEGRAELRQPPGLAQLFSTSRAAAATGGAGAQGGNGAGGSPAQLSLDDVRAATWQTLVHLDLVLTPSSGVPSLSGTSGPPSTPADLAHALSFLVSRTLPAHVAQHGRVARALAPPGALARAWPALVALPLATVVVSRFVYARRAQLAQYARDAADTVRGFVVDWVVEPVRHILETLRGGEDGVVALLGRESLQSDRDSLERMVVDFARDEYGLGGVELETLRDRVRAGDLTAVLKAWEKDIKAPIRSAVSGSLIRTLLIQVQKVKVDVALAMDGIEKMLRSQELTFGFVGVAPSMLVLAVVGRWMRGLTRSDGGRKKRTEVKRRCWMTLRQLDLLLSPPRSSRRTSTSASLALGTSSSSAKPPSRASPLAALTQGNLVLSLSTLRTYAHGPLFPKRDSQLRAAFLDDVRALESGGAAGGGRERRALVRRLERWGGALGWDEGVRA